MREGTVTAMRVRKEESRQRRDSASHVETQFHHPRKSTCCLRGRGDGLPVVCDTAGPVACCKHPDVSRISFRVRRSAAILYCCVFRVLILTVTGVTAVKYLLLRSLRPFTAGDAGDTVNVPGWSRVLHAVGSGFWAGVRPGLPGSRQSPRAFSWVLAS